MDDSDINCLMWADDCVVMSETETGLQIAMDKTVEHFTSLGLSVNVSKTKVMIFNPQGRGSSKFPHVKFYCNGTIVDKCDTYKYLGLIFHPSGSVIPAIKELLIKANRAYFSVSNIFYENERFKVDQAINLFQTLISPIALYGAEYWSVLSLSAKSFQSKFNLLKSWENFIPETLFQRFSRLLLGTHKKTSRLCVMGELGTYPWLIKSLSLTFSYKWSLLNNKDKNSLIYKAVKEMSQMDKSGIDCWLSRVEQSEKLLCLSSPKVFSSRTLSDSIIINILNQLLIYFISIK